MGWLTAPAPVLAAVTRAKQAADLHTATFSQAVLREAAGDPPRLAAHLSTVRALYRGRAGHLVAALRAAFGDRLAVAVPDGGMFCWAEFRDGTDTTALLQTALRHGVAFVPGPAFLVEGGRRSALRLCFASVPEGRFDEGVRRLAAAHAEVSAPLPVA